MVQQARPKENRGLKVGAGASAARKRSAGVARKQALHTRGTGMRAAQENAVQEKCRAKGKRAVV
ncbi:hypothetical protein ACKI2N_015085 [Cupriavidus sp. 30B13]|uniref:hypothetical protein n=1 Tax=Cupriavidus sp. 30B13 TaxID=3384241 RepID=UPI003B911F9E